jgi:Ankyrin repeats (many copies)
VPTVPLPSEPNLEQLEKQAKDLQRAVRAGDPDALAHAAEHDPRRVLDDDARATYPLRAAQLVVARHYGFTGWARLKAYLDVVARYMRIPDRVGTSDDPATEFLRLACLTYENDGPERWEQARQLLDAHPEIRDASIHTAAAVADGRRVLSLLESDTSIAVRDGGPYSWTPLFCLAYARHDPGVDVHAVLDTATALLEHGADPNAGYLWHGLPTPFTVLTGVFGEGELGPVRQPRHPHSLALARVLLDAGADPNDGQALYNRMFEPDNDHLEILFEYGLGTGDGGPWRTLLRDAVDEPAQLVRGQLEWAVVHDMAARVELLVDHGADVNASFADGRTPSEAAASNGNTGLVQYFASCGATAPAVDVVDAFVGAVLAADRTAIGRLRAADPGIVEAARAHRPSLIVWAAAQRRRDAVTLLAELGFDVNARGRGDVPVEQSWETALHQAVANGDQPMAELLLSRGADPDLHDTRFNATPLGWARHLDQPALAELLEPITSEVIDE